MSDQSRPADHADHAALVHVHQTHEQVAGIELTPPHAPRVETPAYKKAHHFLVHEKKAGCAICEVTVDTVRAPDTIETHHFPIERSLLDACDPHKVHRDFPQVYDQATLEQFVDSPANLLVLCSTHHRHPEHGIHHLLVQDWKVQRYLKDGYLVAAATPEDAARDQATDEAIEHPSAPPATQPPATEK